MVRRQSQFQSLIVVLVIVGVLVGVLSVWKTKSRRGIAVPEGEIPASPERTMILAFSGSDIQETLSGLRGEMREHIDVLAPHWLRFDGSGKLTRTIFSEEVVREAHSQGIRVWPLVAYDGPYGRSAGCPPVFCEENTAFRLADRLSTWVTERGVDGLVLDVEYLSVEVKPHLVAFTADLNRLLKRHGRQLWVAVFPQVDFPEEYAGLHSLADLATASDGVVLMTYDKHGPNTGPGPVAPFMWVSQNAAAALEQVPAEKLLLGLPAYGYVWHEYKTGWRTEVLPARRMGMSAEQGGADGEHSTVSGGDAWWDGTTAGRYKALLASELQLAGVAVWRHGLASADLWPHLRQVLD